MLFLALPLCGGAALYDASVAENIKALWLAGGDPLRYFFDNLAFCLSYLVIGLAACRDALRLHLPIKFSVGLFCGGLFVLACGATHGAKAMSFLMPLDDILLLTHDVGAVISVLAAVVLVVLRRNEEFIERVEKI